jgi:hypothetical protein
VEAKGDQIAAFDPLPDGEQPAGLDRPVVHQIEPEPGQAHLEVDGIDGIGLPALQAPVGVYGLVAVQLYLLDALCQVHDP